MNCWSVGACAIRDFACSPDRAPSLIGRAYRCRRYEFGGYAVQMLESLALLRLLTIHHEGTTMIRPALNASVTSR